MSEEFDEHDRNRVRRCILGVIKGFEYALPEYYVGYTHYENAVTTLTQVFSASASCIKIAVDSAEYLDDQDDSDELFKKLCHILEESSAEAYKELGVYFYTLRNSIKEILNANDFKERSFEFSSYADELLKESGEKHEKFLDREFEEFVRKKREAK